MRYANSHVRRAIYYEEHYDGSRIIHFKNELAPYFLGRRHGGKRGGRQNVWWMINPDGTAHNENFVVGLEDAKELADLFKALIDSLEQESKYYMQDILPPGNYNTEVISAEIVGDHVYLKMKVTDK